MSAAEADGDPTNTMSGERGPERPPDIWLLVRQYPDARTALVSYEAARDLLLDDDLDASVLRVTVNGVSFVTVMGEGPLDSESVGRLDVALGRGIASTLPDEVGDALRRRRRAFKHTGIGFLERRSGL